MCSIDHLLDWTSLWEFYVGISRLGQLRRKFTQRVVTFHDLRFWTEYKGENELSISSPPYHTPRPLCFLTVHV